MKASLVACIALLAICLTSMSHASDFTHQSDSTSIEQVCQQQKLVILQSEHGFVFAAQIPESQWSSVSRCEPGSVIKFHDTLTSPFACTVLRPSDLHRSVVNERLSRKTDLPYSQVQLDRLLKRQPAS